ncbi:MAG: hypothetical protein JRH16_04315 [Deltaproteobacteria bacterium]|nr:hypothetical protein [Deltaproteobacteria bacterium]MBW2359861.1 hypothetical protein [Deltaproteobacteria bacterium]
MRALEPGEAAVGLTEAEEVEMVRALHPVLDLHRGPELEIYAVGGPLMHS